MAMKITKALLALLTVLCITPAARAAGPVFTDNVTIQNGGPILRFNDTLSTDTDWRLCVDSTSGCSADQDFHIRWDDPSPLSSGTPFKIENGAGNNLLFLDDAERIGINTSIPAYTVDAVGNRIRLRNSTASNAKTLMMRADGAAVDLMSENADLFIRSPGNDIIMNPFAGDGRVGIGTSNPGGNLHIFGTAGQDVFNGIGPDPQLGPAMNFGYSGSSFGRGSGFFNVRPDALATGINPSLRFATNNLQRMVITNAGRVGVGTTNPSQALDVSGNIRASGNFISGGTTLNVPDYVFEEDYTLPPLAEVEAYVQREKHLPEMPSAAEIKAEGLNMTEFQMGLLKKVEELTLYTLEQEQTLQAQQQTIQEQASTLKDLQAQEATITALQGTITTLVERLASLEQANAHR